MNECSETKQFATLDQIHYIATMSKKTIYTRLDELEAQIEQIGRRQAKNSVKYDTMLDKITIILDKITKILKIQ